MVVLLLFATLCAGRNDGPKQHDAHNAAQCSSSDNFSIAFYGCSFSTISYFPFVSAGHTRAIRRRAEGTAGRRSHHCDGQKYDSHLLGDPKCAHPGRLCFKLNLVHFTFDTHCLCATFVLFVFVLPIFFVVECSSSSSLLIKPFHSFSTFFLFNSILALQASSKQVPCCLRRTNRNKNEKFHEMQSARPRPLLCSQIEIKRNAHVLAQHFHDAPIAGRPKNRSRAGNYRANAPMRLSHLHPFCVASPSTESF